MANWTANVPFIYDKILTGRYIMPEGKTYLLKCIECGADFFTEGEKSYYKSKGLSMPKRCKPCRDKRKLRFEQEREEKELKGFLLTLPFKQTEMTEIPLADPDTTLFVIGNGFDIMHGVPSSYYNFRDTIGKNNILRFTLETYILIYKSNFVII